MRKVLITFILGCFSLALLTCCFSFHGNAQTTPEAQTLYNKEFKWTISIPKGFDAVDAEKLAQMQKIGSDAIEQTYDGKVENNTTTIFSFRNDQFNYFESNYQPFDTTVDGNYLEAFYAVNAILYKTFETQTKDTKLDSSSSTQTISGLTFHVFKIVITFPNNIVMTGRIYSRLFGKKELTVNIVTADKQKEKELLDAWLNSRFDK